MQSQVQHPNHTHGPTCGHKRIKHENHLGFLHDGKLHCEIGEHLEDHSLTHKTQANSCKHACQDHSQEHSHGDNCGHPKVPHNGHFDYLVNGHLHHPHASHCDNHGEVEEECAQHRNHGDHQHKEGCGHTQIIHDGHVGFLHNGHLHCPHEDHVDEHTIQVTKEFPTGCVNSSKTCAHVHGPSCGHPAIPHGDHVDYLVNGVLHHSHNGHCDQHGNIKVVLPKHPRHNHVHEKGCGHPTVQHEGHVDYLHDGHLHHHDVEGGYEEHSIEVTKENPAECTPSHSCSAHEAKHLHGASCGHLMVLHGDHYDYFVNGHLHYPHGDHCDDHGKLVVAQN